jgi:hypothetical protein
MSGYMSDAKGLVGRRVHADALADSIETGGLLARDKRKKRGPRRAEGIKTRLGTGGRGDCLFRPIFAAAPDDPEKGGLSAFPEIHDPCQGSGTTREL